MKKQFVLMALIVSVMMSGNLWAGSQPANAGPPFSSKPANVVTVATSGGDYTTIMAALNSIADASATKPYVIKVMPGIYNESITMKAYVDVVGSGRENTKITSSGVTTVAGADNSTLENIWIDNSGSIERSATAIANDNVVTQINNVKVTMNNPLNSHATGIRYHGNIKGVVSNSVISVTSGEYDGILGITTEYSADVTVLNCNIDVRATSPNDWNAGILAMSTVTVRDSVIYSEGTRYNFAIYGGYYVTVSNTVLTVASTGNAIANVIMKNGGAVTGSKLYLVGSATQQNCISDGAVKIGSSLIQAPIQGPYCGTPKLANNWDGDFNPIPNQ